MTGTAYAQVPTTSTPYVHYTTYSTGDLLVSIVLCIVILGIGFVAYKHFVQRTNARNFLCDYMTAFKVGLIKKEADEDGIELIFPPKVEEKKKRFTDTLRKEVEEEMGRT